MFCVFFCISTDSGEGKHTVHVLYYLSRWFFCTYFLWWRGSIILFTRYIFVGLVYKANLNECDCMVIFFEIGFPIFLHDLCNMSTHLCLVNDVLDYVCIAIACTLYPKSPQPIYQASKLTADLLIFLFLVYRLCYLIIIIIIIRHL